MNVRTRGGKPAQDRQLRAAGQRNVANLLDAALIVFADRGYHQARVDDVCAQADVSHGTFYLYFASKEDLFGTLVEEVVEEMRDLAGRLPAITSGAAGRNALRSWLGEFHDLYVRYFPVIQAWNEANASDPAIAQMGARVLRRFIDRLVERVEENHTGPVDGVATGALIMVAMVERSLTFAIGGVVRHRPEELLDQLTDILHVGLFGGRRER